MIYSLILYSSRIQVPCHLIIGSLCFISKNDIYYLFFFFFSLMTSDIDFCKQIIDELSNEIYGSNIDVIHKYEQSLANDITITSQLDSFYNLPLKCIQNIISKVNVDDIINYQSVIGNIIDKTVQYHPNDDQLINLITSIPCNTSVVSVRDCINLISKFPNVPLFLVLNQLYLEEMTLVDVDYEYKLKKKEEESQKLKEEIKQLESRQNPNPKYYEYTTPLPKKSDIKKPLFFEPDIFKAVRNGKLSSVKYHIEHENVRIDQKNGEGKSLYMIAKENNQKDIVDYLGKRESLSIQADDDVYKLKFQIIGYFPQILIQLLDAIVKDDKKNTTNLLESSGCDFRNYKTQIGQNNFQIQIWINLIKFKTISKSYIKIGNAIMFSYDVGNSSSFDKIKVIIENAKSFELDRKQMILVGIITNGEDRRQVPKEHGEEIVNLYGFSHFFEVSPKDSEGCQQMIRQIAKDFLPALNA